MPNVIDISWAAFALRVQKLSALIKDSGIKYDYLYGIPRGGLIPAVMLSHILQIPVTVHLNWDDLIINYKVLIVDDIADSGKTIEKFINIFDIATVYCKIHLHKKPKFYAVEVSHDEWIKFPYETAVNDPISEINMVDRVEK